MAPFPQHNSLPQRSPRLSAAAAAETGKVADVSNRKSVQRPHLEELARMKGAQEGGSVAVYRLSVLAIWGARILARFLPEARRLSE